MSLGYRPLIGLMYGFLEGLGMLFLGGETLFEKKYGVTTNMPSVITIRAYATITSTLTATVQQKRWQ